MRCSGANDARISGGSPRDSDPKTKASPVPVAPAPMPVAPPVQRAPVIQPAAPVVAGGERDGSKARSKECTDAMRAYVVEHLGDGRLVAIGQAALARVLAEHTYELRGRQVDVWTYCGALAGGRSSPSASWQLSPKRSSSRAVLRSR